jgi:beta-lactamase superfamily II metal-dependent hydrolase
MNRSWITPIFLFIFGALLQAQNLSIHHINVGQGDATLLVSPTGTTFLIDAGDNSKGTSKVLPYLQSLGVTKLDFVVATHYHADHIGGLDEVINGLGAGNVVTVYDRGTAHTVPTTVSYTSYASSASSASGGRHTLTVGTVIDLGGGVTVKCLASDGSVLGYGAVAKATSSENDLSSAWLVSFNEFRFFTGGDCGGEASAYADLETPIASYSGVGAVDALKIDHHGSTYSTNQAFVNTLQPTAAVITVGTGNSYFHPVQSVLDRLAAANCYMYLTETGNGGTLAAGQGVVANGNIVINTTGHNTFTVVYGTQTDTYPLHLPPTGSVSVSVTPATASVNSGATYQFTAAVTGSTDTSVTWSATGGTVSGSGLYTAPAAAGTYSVTATSVADPSKSASSTVTVAAAPVVSVSITPASASMNTNATYQFTASVTGSTNTSVTWSATGGTVDAAGLYTAPAIAGTYSVTATSVADPSKSASSTVTVVAAPSDFTEIEANNTRATANIVGANVTTITGYFPGTSDVDDYFAVTLLPGRTLTVNMTGPTASNQNYDLYLYSSTGTQLARSKNAGTTERVTYKNTSTTAAKTIYIDVRRVASYSYVTPYTLTVSR